MPLQQLLVRLDAGDVAHAEALLQLAGAEALILDSAGGEPVWEPAPGEAPLWGRVLLRALFADGVDLSAAASLLAGLQSAAEIRIAPLADADWMRARRHKIRPRKIGEKLLLTPAEEHAADSARRQIKLHMGLAFGTGEHPTTLLCLEWLDGHLEPGQTVLDYGWGSGVLAIAALRLGAAYAWAVDTERQALDATAANAELNAVADRLWIGAPGALEPVEADVIVANILARPLQQLAPRFAARTRYGGHIVLSGILEDQADSVVSAYTGEFEDFEHAQRAGWVRIAARRRPPVRSHTDDRHSKR